MILSWRYNKLSKNRHIFLFFTNLIEFSLKFSQILAFCSIFMNFYQSSEGEFLVKKVWREFGMRLTAKLQIAHTKLHPNS